MKRPYVVLILALAGSLVCNSARAQQTQPAPSPGPAGISAPAADPLKDPNCQRRFEAMFGPEAIKVDLSTSKTDDADFAEKLAATAVKAADDTSFQVYLYDKACIFGLRLPRTLALVQQALAKLDSLAPRQRRCWQEYQMALLRQLYRQAKAADRAALGENLIVELIMVGDLRAQDGKWDEAAELYQQAVQTATALRSPQKDAAAERLNQANRRREVLVNRRRLEQNPGDAKLRMAVIDAYLGILDDPGGVAELLNAEVDEAYRTYVPLAARYPGELTPGLLMELGNWYKTLARQAPAAHRPTLVKRTIDYYLANIDKIRRQGATVSAVQAALAKINAGLKDITQDKLPGKLLFRDPVVQKSFERAVKWLWSAQAADGSWMAHRATDARYHGAVNTFSTAEALATLLASGASADDARAVKAIRWLEPTITRKIDDIAFRCLAWQEVQKQKPGRAGQLLANDMSILIHATRSGGYGETVMDWKTTTLGQSWQAPLAVDAAEQCGLKAQRAYWQLVAGYWAGLQWTDGCISSNRKGDAKKTGPASTIIGAGSLAIALGRLYGPEAVKNPTSPQCEPLARALGWLDRNFTTLADLRSENSSDQVILGDVTCMLSSLGLATGQDKIGQVKWWTDGGRFLASLQKADGSWGHITDTTTAVLFMINGYKFEQANCGAMPSLIAAGATTRPATTAPATTQDAGTTPPAPDDREAMRLLHRRESALKSRLSANPGNTAAAEQLVCLYVMELHEPQKALEYADQTGNFLVRRLIGLLDKDTSLLYPGELLGMADWHMDLAEGASYAVRKLALTRAVAYYQGYLARKPAMPAEAAKARASLEEARGALSDMGGQ